MWEICIYYKTGREYLVSRGKITEERVKSFLAHLADINSFSGVVEKITWRCLDKP